MTSDELIEEVYIDESTSDDILPEVRILNRAAQLQQIEKQNQFLKDELTPAELEQILVGLEKTASKLGVSEKRMRVSILLTLSLFTSYNLMQSHYLRWLAKKPKLRTGYINLSEDCAFVYIPTPRYSHNELSKAAPLYFNIQDGMVKLAVPRRIQAILTLLLTAYYALDKTKIKKSSVIRDDITKNDIKRIIKSYRLDSRVTMSLVQNNFAKNMLFYTNGDLWATAAISGREDATSSTQKHYTTVEQPYLQTAYRQVINSLFFEDIQIDDKPNAKSFLAHGDAFRPKKYEVVKFLNYLSNVIQKIYIAQSHKNWSIESVIDTVNLVMIFMETHQCYITGARDVKNPFISPLQLDSENFYTLNDKNINNGYTTRLGYLPSKLVTELENFMQHIEILLYKLKKQPNFKKSSLDKTALSETWMNAKLSADRKSVV